MKVHIFDLDGTLVDSMPVWAGSILSVLDSENVKYPPDVVEHVVTLSSQESANYYSSLGLSGTPDQINGRIFEKMEEGYREKVVTKPCVAEYLEKLRAEEKRLFVLTASPHGIVELCLERNGIFRYFEEVWTADDFGYNKSDPEIYRAAAKRVKTPPRDICFYDDNAAAIRAAKESGLYVVGVFDAYAKRQTAEIKRLADRYINGFSELI